MSKSPSPRPQETDMSSLPTGENIKAIEKLIAMPQRLLQSESAQSDVQNEIWK